VIRGNSRSIQNKQSVSTLVLLGPLSLAFDINKQFVYAVFFSGSKKALLEKKDTVFLQFSQIFPDSSILSTDELRDLQWRLSFSTNVNGKSLTNVLIPITVDFLDDISTVISEYITHNSDCIFVIPYIELLHDDCRVEDRMLIECKENTNSEAWIARTPYLVINSGLQSDSDISTDFQSHFRYQNKSENQERLSLLLPQSGSEKQDAHTCITALIQILEFQDNRSSNSVYTIQSSFDMKEATTKLERQTEQSSIEILQTRNEERVNKSKNQELVSSQINLEIPSLALSGISSDAQKNIFCIELCRLKQLSLTAEMLQKYCQGFHRNSLRLLADPSIRSQMERAKLVGIDDLATKTRHLCKDLPSIQTLCLLCTFACSDGSVFDLKELNDLVHVLRLTIPLWIQEDTKTLTPSPSRTSFCSKCRLREISPELCTRIATNLNYLVNNIVSQLPKDSQILETPEKRQKIRKIIQEVRSQDIRIILPCIHRAVNQFLPT